MMELCMIKFDQNFKILDKYCRLFKIPVPVPEHIVKITGINDYMLRDQKYFRQRYNNIEKFMRGVTDLVGHNINFDIDIIKNELIRIEKQFDFEWPETAHCTVDLSLPIYNRRMKLKELYMLATGREHEGAHRAEADVLANIEGFKFLIEQDYVRGL